MNRLFIGFSSSHIGVPHDRGDEPIAPPQTVTDICQQQPKSDPLQHLNIDPLFFKVFH